MHEELELKLRCSDAFEPSVALAWLRQHGELTAAGERRHLDLYLDTPDGRLQAAGLSARRRSEASKTTAVQIKPVPLVPAVVMRRSEIETTLGNDREATTVLRGLLQRELGLRVPDTLRSVVELDARRERWELHAAQYEAELSFDRVRARKPGEARHHDFVELELELVTGSAGAFEAMATSMAAAMGARGRAELATTSKLVHARAQLGYPAFFGRVPLPALHARMRLGMMARDLGRALMMRLRMREQGTRMGLDPEQLRQMRRATRRLGVLLDVFRAVFETPTRKALRVELSWLEHRLARVWDVEAQRGSVPGWRRRLGGPAIGYTGWAAFDEALQRGRTAARAELVEALDSARYGRLLALADAALASSEESITTAGQRRAGPRIARLMGRPMGRLRRAANRFADKPTVLEAERLRGRTRGLRDALMLLRPLAGPRLRRQARQLAALEAELDELHRTQVAATLMESLVPGVQGDLGYAFVLGQLHGASAMGMERAAEAIAQGQWSQRSLDLLAALERTLGDQ